jgi:hypothetical protein
MPRTNLWSQSVARVELDQRSREARLQFERIDRSFILRGTATHSGLRRLLYRFTARRYGGLPQEGGVKEPLSDRWASRLPMLLGIWWKMLGCATCPAISTSSQYCRIATRDI